MSVQQTNNAELRLTEQEYGEDPLTVRETDHYRKEYITTFVDKWDELIDWRRRAETEGQFFIDILRARGQTKSARCGVWNGLSLRAAGRVRFRRDCRRRFCGHGGKGLR